MTASHLEETLRMQLLLAELPEGEAEVRVVPRRKWRFDRAWPDRMLAVEIEGGTWSNGRHTRGSGYASDCQKYNEAVLAGWRVLRFTGGQVVTGEALLTIQRALNNTERETSR